MVKELFDFSYIFGRKEKVILFAFIFVYTVFALNIVPVDIPMLMALLLFILAPVHVAFFLFSFYVLFENVSVFSWGITLNLLVQLILTIKVMIFILNNKRIFTLRGGKLKLVYLSYFLIYGFIAFLSADGFTGLSIALRLFIVCYAISYMQLAECRYSFWKAIFHLMYIATIVSAVYGIFNDTSVERYISGLEGSYAFQLYGSLGTTRLGMFTVCSLVYPLYFVRHNILKYLLLGVMIILTFLTVSMTAIATMGMLFLIYFISLGKIKQMIKYGTICLVLLVSTYGIWSNLSFVQPIIYRVEFARAALEYGDMNAVTSDRADLSEVYISDFKKRDIVSQAFGVFDADNLDESLGKYSHNSYIDILSYTGIIGVILIWFFCLKNVLNYRRTDVFYPVLCLKLVMLVPAFTVSIFNSLYWTWFIFI